MSYCTLGHVLLGLAAVVGCILISTEAIPGRPTRHKFVASLLLVVGLFALDRWVVSRRKPGEPSDAVELEKLRQAAAALKDAPPTVETSALEPTRTPATDQAELRTQRASGAWLDLTAEPGGRTHKRPFPFVVWLRNEGTLGGWYSVSHNCIELAHSEPSTFHCQDNENAPERWMPPFREEPVVERIDLLPTDGDWHLDQIAKGEKNAYGYVEVEFRDGLSNPGWVVEGCWVVTRPEREFNWNLCKQHNGTRKKL